MLDKNNKTKTEQTNIKTTSEPKERHQKQKKHSTVTEAIHASIHNKKPPKITSSTDTSPTQSGDQNVSSNKITDDMCVVGDMAVVMLPEKVVDFDANGNIIYPNIGYGTHYSKTVEFIKKLYKNNFHLVSVNFNPLKNGFYLWFQKQQKQ